MDSLITTVLDLDAALGGRADLLIGGGLGLYLKQAHLEGSGVRTLVPVSSWPMARATLDVDLFLAAEVAVDSARLLAYSRAIRALGFAEIESARYYQFVRRTAQGHIKLDVHAAPLGELASRVRPDSRRVRPRPSVQLHARRTEEALGVEYRPQRIALQGRLASGTDYECNVLVPRAFPYAIMKLFALRDRVDDPEKALGMHHALDLYRIAMMLTVEEVEIAAELAGRLHGHNVVLEALRIIEDLFATKGGLGRVRLQQHPQAPVNVDADWLAAELRRLLTPIA